MNAEDIINKLEMLPHPEGGYYKETYRSEEQTINKEGNKRNTSTAIYFLLENNNISRFHRIKSDELWFFHQGNAIEIVSIKNNKLVSITLGNDIDKGEVPQAVIPANVWFASSVKDGSGFGLVSCTVAPGFDFADFEMAKQDELLQEYPMLESVIKKYT
jgi:predicted cupin superfamily sugar epimerase